MLDRAILSDANRRMEFVLQFISETLTIDSLETLLRKVVNKVPSFLSCKHCSIYLIPEVVKEYDGNLLGKNGVDIKAGELKKDFIVLAASGPSEITPVTIGKYFYEVGEGLTGWAFAEKRAFVINSQNGENTFFSSRLLKQENKYSAQAVEGFDTKNVYVNEISFILMPLEIHDRCIGVMRIMGAADGRPFPDYYANILRVVCNILVRYIEQRKNIDRKQGSIENLMSIKIRDEKDRKKAFSTIINEIKNNFDEVLCNLYILDSRTFGEQLHLKATSDPFVEKMRKRGISKHFARGEGLTGWIFKTGKPLLINDIHSFRQKSFLSDQLIKEYSNYPIASNFPMVNEEDRFIRVVDEELHFQSDVLSRFMGLPVLSPSGKVLGVLTVMSKSDRSAFTENDMRLLKTFCDYLSALTASIKQEHLKNVLLRFGQEDENALFQYVVESVPRLVLGQGCSIFLKSDDNDFELRFTNSTRLMKNPITKEPLEIRYKPEVGKTGLVAKLGRTLIINHYGDGELDHYKLKEDYNKFDTDERYADYNLVGCLKNITGKEVGLARLVRQKKEADFTMEEVKQFYEFTRTTVFSGKGLPCNEPKKLCEQVDEGFTQSFLAVPLKGQNGEVFGVLRIPRSFPGGVFTEGDLLLVLSITKRLSSLLERDKMVKEKQQLIEKHLKTLSTINNRINSSSAQEEILDRILEAATDEIGFEFATIQVVNESERTIETNKGKKNSKIGGALNPVWVGLKHFWNPPSGTTQDIHAYILDLKEAKIISGWDEHFDREIYDKYHHENLIRAFIPIIAYSEKNEEMPIGTLEAGHSMNRKNYIDDTELEMLQALANQAAIAIKNSRLLKNVQDLKENEVKKTIWEEVAQEVPHKMIHSVRANELHLSLLDKALEKISKEYKATHEEVNKARQQKRRLSLIQNEIVGFLNELQEISVGTNVQLKEEVLEALMDYCLELCGTENKLTVEKCFDNLPKIRLDREKIKTCFMALLSNAADFVPEEDGKIIISARWATEDEKIKYHLDKTVHYVKINLRDNGRGVPENMKDRIFDPLVSDRRGLASTKSISSGLGLSVARKYIQMHGGIIHEVGSEKKGADFEIFLPAGEGEQDGKAIDNR